LEPWAAIPTPGFDSKPSSDITFSISISWFAKVSLVMVGSLTKSGSTSAGAAVSTREKEAIVPFSPSRSPLGSKQPWPEGGVGSFSRT